METCGWGQCSYNARRGGDNDLPSLVLCSMCDVLHVICDVLCRVSLSGVHSVQSPGRGPQLAGAGRRRLESTQPRLQPQRRSGGGAGGFCRDINFFLKGSSK